jgi:dephospho-CoA kinase
VANALQRRAMYIIGLTGNIGTGKSTVGRMLVELGARYVDADAVAHEVTRKDGTAYDAVVREFGRGILSPDGEIDRRKLGAIVFSDGAKMRRLEALTHPAVLARMGQVALEATGPALVLDAIKLLESGMRGLCDALWVVTCPKEQQVARLMGTRGLTRREALQRIEAQPPQEEKVRQADVVIDNGGSLEKTRRQVRVAWQAVLGELTAEGGGR